MEAKTEATIEDLYNAPNDRGTYELVDGKLVHMPPTGFGPGRTSGEIYFSLKLYERENGLGYAIPDNVGYIVNLPNRRSFTPDASFALTAPANRMRFIDGAPIFAVEVRSEHDYGPGANAESAAKRRDYFAAGTVVVWDVDPVLRTVRCYHAPRPDKPQTFQPEDTADAEPALSGWRIAVEDIFR
jgi:Uma2 family endonuclease